MGRPFSFEDEGSIDNVEPFDKEHPHCTGLEKTGGANDRSLAGQVRRSDHLHSACPGLMLPLKSLDVSR